MAASFASRLSSLREKKINPTESEEGTGLRLTLPADTSQKSSYEPSSSNSNVRTSFRLLKGRIERKQSTEKIQIGSSNSINETKGLNSSHKLALLDEPKTEMKLRLSDEPYVPQKKPIGEPPKIPLQKRILIAKEEPKEEPKRQEPPKRQQPKRQQPPPQPKISQQGSSKAIIPSQQKPINQEQAQESLPPESENDLVPCPQGCGRTFNRKALQKHVKACKLVFMSKRKQFNSQAKRISKEQAAINKQQKIQEKKKMAATKGKGFDKNKTGDNWKAASEDFRAAIKAIKKQENEDEKKEKEEGEQEEPGEPGEDIEDVKVVIVTCQYCEKKFNEVFIQKHMETCAKRKERPRSKQKKKTTKR